MLAVCAFSCLSYQKDDNCCFLSALKKIILFAWDFSWNVFTVFNPLMLGGNKKVTHTETVGLFKYMWPFCYHQALKS